MEALRAVVEAGAVGKAEAVMEGSRCRGFRQGSLASLAL